MAAFVPGCHYQNSRGASQLKFTSTSLPHTRSCWHLTPPIALAFTYIEHILLAPDTPLAVTRAISALESTQPLLDDAGFEKLAYEDFYDCFISLINNIIMPEGNGRLLTPAILLEAFNIPEGNICRTRSLLFI